MNKPLGPSKQLPPDQEKLARGIAAKVEAQALEFWSHALGDSLIGRVESRMSVPFNKLSAQDQEERLELGWRRLREALSSVPFYRKAAQSHPSGEKDYWINFWYSQVNLVGRR